jgi:hypothetical protein
MRQVANTYDETIEIINELKKTGHDVALLKLADGTFQIDYIECKGYTTYDDKVFPDEVWITEAGEMLHIQDLSEDHAKNVIRMMLRQDRQISEMMAGYAEKIGDALSAVMEKLEDEPGLSGKYLH